MDYAGLKAEDAKPIYTGMSDAQRLAALNASVTQPVSRGIIPAAQLYGDLAARQIPYKVSLLPDTTSPVNVGTADAPQMIPVGAVKQAIDDLKYSEVANTGDATVQGMLYAGVLFGVITQQQMSDLLMTTQTQSIAQSLGFGVLALDDLLTARRQ